MTGAGLGIPAVVGEHRIAVVRSARYFTLGHADPGAAAERELWIVCHGYGQLASEFVRQFAVIARPGRLIVAPEGLSRFYVERDSGLDGAAPRVGATWMTREDREAEISDQLRYLDAVLAVVAAPPAAGGPTARVRVLGFSQGVATVGRWLALGAARADELILWAGGFPPELTDDTLRERLGRTAVTIVLGRRDAHAGWADAEALARRFERAGVGARLMTFDGGHRLDDATLRAIADGVPVAMPNG